MIREINTLMDRLNDLESLLNEYNSFTNVLLSIDFEEPEQTDTILSNRAEVITRIDETRSKITNLINMQEKQNSINLRKMFSSQTSLLGSSLSDEEKQLRSKIIDIRSIQIDIMKKDAENASRLKSKREDIRSELAELKNDKRKINFYNNVSINAKGESFDSQT